MKHVKFQGNTSKYHEILANRRISVEIVNTHQVMLNFECPELVLYYFSSLIWASYDWVIPGNKHTFSERLSRFFTSRFAGNISGAVIAIAGPEELIYWV